MPKLGGMNLRRDFTHFRQALLVAAALAAFAAPAAAERSLFAMDTGTRDAKIKTYAEQAALAKRLGYSGIGFTGCAKIPEMLAAADAEGIAMSTIYTGMQIKNGNIGLDGLLETAIGQLAGRETVIWIFLGGSRPDDPSKTDAPVVEALQNLADLAAKSKLKIALYPHAGAYADRVVDCVRVAKKVGRANLGVTFNLCHWLKVDGEDLEERITDAMPHLFVVTVNGADSDGSGWDTLIQPLDRGSFDVAQVIRLLDKLDYKGSVGLQHYGIRGDAEQNLGHSMAGWRGLQARSGAEKLLLIPGGDLSAFEDKTAWFPAAEVGLDPENAKKLIGKKPGGAAVLNGLGGRSGHLVTKREFGDVEVHIEFMISGSSNSGAYFMGRYEVQVYDSHGVVKDKYPGLECGGIYPRWIGGKNVEGHSPRLNVSRPPGEWQSFHVIFRAPRFDKDGKKTANAKFEEVWHNGSLIHENLELKGPTRAGIGGGESATGPLMLQGDHGPVAYRNVWMAELK
jgi:sugar phosphate isomerase/epimerase